MTNTPTTSPAPGPVENTSLTFDEGIEAIGNLLTDDPETDLGSADGAKIANETEAEEDGDDVDLAMFDDETDEAADEQAEASSEPDDNALVTLSDGQKISIADLKRNNLFQRDYSKKTEELKRERERFEAEFREKTSAVESEITQRRDFILDNWQFFVPQPPSDELMDPNSDKFDIVEYTVKKSEYEKAIARLNAMHNERMSEQQRMTAAQQQEMAAKRQEEQEKLFEALPKLKDEQKRKAFKAEALDIGVKHYGLTEQEVNSIPDHRLFRILHDAIEYKKLKDKAAAAKTQVQAKPRLVQKQRQNFQGVQSRDRNGRFEALRQSGSIDAAAASIMDLID